MKNKILAVYSLFKYPAFFLIISIIFFYKILFFEYFIFNEDNRDLFIPNKLISTNSIKNSEFPLWDTYRFGGTSMLAEIQSQNFYPPYYIFSFIKPEKQIDYLTLLHFAFAGYFMFLLISYKIKNIFAALFAGIIFMFSGPFAQTLKDANYIITATLCWLPLIILFFFKMLETTKFQYFIYFTIAVCLQIFAGHLQFVFYTHILVLGIFIRNIIVTNKKNCKKFCLYLSSGILCFCLTAIQLIPTYNFSQTTDRAGGVSYTKGTALSLKPDQLLTFIFPDFFGDREFNFFGPSTTYYVGYCGTIALFFALYYFVYSKLKLKFYIIFISFLSIFLAIGKLNPLYIYIYKLPGFNFFRAPARAILFFSIAVIISAVYGFALFLSTKKISKYFFLIPISGFAAIGLITFFDSFALQKINEFYKYIYALGIRSVWLNYFVDNGVGFNAILIMQKSLYIFSISFFIAVYLCRQFNDEHQAYYLKILLKFLYSKLKITNEKVFFGVIIMLTLINLWITDLKLLNLSIQPASIVYALPETANKINSENNTGIFRINAAYYIHLTWNILNNFEDINGRTAYLNRDFVEYLGRLDTHINFFKLLNLKYCLYSSSITAPAGFSKIFEEKYNLETYKLYKINSFLPRFYVINKLFFLKKKLTAGKYDTGDIYNFIGSDSFIPEVSAVIYEQDKIFFSDVLQYSDTAINKILNYSISNIIYNHNNFSLIVNTEKPSVMMLSHIYNEDWICENNEKKTKIFRANHLFSSIILNKGINKLKFNYKPF